MSAQGGRGSLMTTVLFRPMRKNRESSAALAGDRALTMTSMNTPIAAASETSALVKAVLPVDFL